MRGRHTGPARVSSALPAAAEIPKTLCGDVEHRLPLTRLRRLIAKTMTLLEKRWLEGTTAVSSACGSTQLRLSCPPVAAM